MEGGREGGRDLRITVRMYITFIHKGVGASRPLTSLPCTSARCLSVLRLRLLGFVRRKASAVCVFFPLDTYGIREYASYPRDWDMSSCKRENSRGEREKERERERASERAWAAFGLSQTLLGDNAGGGADHSAAEDTVLRVASGSRHASDPVLLFCGVFARARNAHAHLAVRGSCALCDARSEQGLNVPRGGPWRVNCITSMPRLAAFSSRLVLLAALAVCARRQRCRALLVCCELLPCPLLPKRAAPAYCRWPHFARSPAGQALMRAL